MCTLCKGTERENVAQRDLVSGMRSPETIWTHLRPCEPLEVGVVWRPLLGYMYTLYITYARADDLSQTKRGSSEGALCIKMGS